MGMFDSFVPRDRSKKGNGNRKSPFSQENMNMKRKQLNDRGEESVEEKKRQLEDAKKEADSQIVNAGLFGNQEEVRAYENNHASAQESANHEADTNTNTNTNTDEDGEDGIFSSIKSMFYSSKQKPNEETSSEVGREQRRHVPNRRGDLQHHTAKHNQYQNQSQETSHEEKQGKAWDEQVKERFKKSDRDRVYGIDSDLIENMEPLDLDTDSPTLSSHSNADSDSNSNSDKTQELNEAEKNENETETESESESENEGKDVEQETETELDMRYSSNAETDKNSNGTETETKSESESEEKEIEEIPPTSATDSDDGLDEKPMESEAMDERNNVLKENKKENVEAISMDDNMGEDMKKLFHEVYQSFETTEDFDKDKENEEIVLLVDGKNIERGMLGRTFEVVQKKYGRPITEIVFFVDASEDKDKIDSITNLVGKIDATANVPVTTISPSFGRAKNKVTEMALFLSERIHTNEQKQQAQQNQENQESQKSTNKKEIYVLVSRDDEMSPLVDFLIRSKKKTILIFDKKANHLKEALQEVHGFHYGNFDFRMLIMPSVIPDGIYYRFSKYDSSIIKKQNVRMFEDSFYNGTLLHVTFQHFHYLLPIYDGMPKNVLSKFISDALSIDVESEINEEFLAGYDIKVNANGNLMFGEKTKKFIVHQDSTQEKAEMDKLILSTCDFDLINYFYYAKEKNPSLHLITVDWKMKDGSIIKAPFVDGMRPYMFDNIINALMEDKGCDISVKEMTRHLDENGLEKRADGKIYQKKEQ